MSGTSKLAVALPIIAFGPNVSATAAIIEPQPEDASYWEWQRSFVPFKVNESATVAEALRPAKATFSNSSAVGYRLYFPTGSAQYSVAQEDKYPAATGELQKAQIPNSVDVTVLLDVFAPRATTPAPQQQWLGKVLNRIAKSSADNAIVDSHPGKYVTHGVRDQANQFFKFVGDLLPREPYLYAAQTGELIAEFGSGRDAVTAAVSADGIVLLKSGATGVRQQIISSTEKPFRMRAISRDFLSSEADPNGLAGT